MTGRRNIGQRDTLTLGGGGDMTTAKKGDTVRVEYVGTLGDGTIFDSSEGSDPLEFTLGEGTVISGFENAVEGMEVGQTLTTTIEASDAYGVADPRLRVDVPNDRFPDDIEPQVGQHLQVTQQDGTTIPVTVAEVAEEVVTLDANHPLAGRDLTFEITLVSVG
jgi:peptidylprolyl isomerase